MPDLDAALERLGAYLDGRYKVPYIGMMSDLRALLDAYRAVRKRLDCNLCNSGHETLPLSLWNCPVCCEEREATLRARCERLEGALRAWRDIGCYCLDLERLAPCDVCIQMRAALEGEG